MKIGVDIMGGDYAPLEAVQGIVKFHEEVSEYSDVRFVLYGDLDKSRPYLNHLSNYTNQYDAVHCNDVIEMNEHPTKALKEKQDSSISRGLNDLAEGHLDAFVSAGNTGAMLVSALYSVKSIPGVIRPTIASPIPKLSGGFNFLLDVGAIADCKPEYLVQFAQMGSIYAKMILGLEQPKVGLLNLGEEEGKGNILAQMTYPLLKALNTIQFVGNVEGRDVFLDSCDVIVCEGFTGNVMLKMAESFYDIFHGMRNVNDEFLSTFNYENYGGIPILGINAPVIIGHGISRAKAFKSMYLTAAKMVETGIINKLEQAFA